MECADIKALMSEYLDDALDARRKEALEQHVSTCRACEEELAGLRAVIHELGSLEPVAAPDDFLDKLHERLEQDSILARVRRKLFSPFHIKFPLELAGAAAVAVLVFVAVNVQLSRKEIIPRTDLATPERVAESVAERPKEQAFKKEIKTAAPAAPATPSGTGPIRERVMAGKQMTKAATLAEERAPAVSLEPKRRQPVHPADRFIELAVLIRAREEEVRYGSEPAADEVAEREAPRVAEEMSSAPASEGLSTLKGKTAWEGTDPEALLSRVKGLIEDAAGDVTAVLYNEETGQLKHITAQIPPSNYNAFARALSRMTTLQKRLPEPMDKDAETIRVRITFVYSE